jgi:DNA-binding NtrC family response regulator
VKGVTVKQRVLLIDDEPQMLRQLARILEERTPHEIRTEENPLEVPRILEQETFDLIITDMGMPGMDGMEILEFVRERNRFEEVVIITAFGSLGSVLEALSLDVFDYIVKPFRKTRITATVERAMAHQRRKREDLRLREIIRRLPYAEAEAEFRREYLRRAAEEYGDDPAELARRTGLAIDAGRPGEADSGKNHEE